MKIAKDSVVRFHYTLFDGGSFDGGQIDGGVPAGDDAADGAAEARREPLESSKDREPLTILVGHGNIIPGLEKALDGHEAGDAFAVDVVAADAYGERRDGLGQRVPKKHFGAQKLEPGMQIVLNTNFGPRAVTIQKVGMSVVDVDLNHPMAGRDLRFEIEIVEVRAASAEEIEHGHVHGEGGHQH